MPSIRLKKYAAVFAPLILGFVAYSIAAFSTFSIPQLEHVGLDPLVIMMFASIDGLIAVAFGYASIVILGGEYSLTIGGLIARVTKTRQLLESKEEKSIKLRQKLIEKSHLLYLPALLFFTSVALGWDIYSADPPHTTGTGKFNPILHSLNFLATPSRANAVLYSLRLTPALIAITVISGLIPSVALPYFRRFKVTGINAGPFHSSLLTAVVGSVVGLSIVQTLLGVFYQVFWTNQGPASYHYALIVLMGLSLHYAAGTYLGRDKAESIIMKKLENKKYDHKRIVVLNRSTNPNAKEVEFMSLIDV